MTNLRLTETSCRLTEGVSFTLISALCSAFWSGLGDLMEGLESFEKRRSEALVLESLETP
jgi:hypothetical protein